MTDKNKDSNLRKKKNSLDLQETFYEDIPSSRATPHFSYAPEFYGQYNSQNFPYSYAQAYPPVYSYENSPHLHYGRQGQNSAQRSLTDENSSEGTVRSTRKKITLKYIESKSKRGVTFSKRKKGIMKKAYELNVLTGTQILLLVASESGHVYTFATPKLKPIITEHEHLIQQCLSVTPNEDKGYDYSMGETYDDNGENKQYYNLNNQMRKKK